MKLYPLLFTNEAAKSVSAALGSGAAAVEVGRSQTDSRVVLVDTEVVLRLVRKQHANTHLYTYIVDADGVLAEVGYSKSRSDPNLVSVYSSAGIHKHGPLAYQLVMYSISPSWLRSDSTLSEDSQAVWDMMYRMSGEGGVYERKWVGEFGNPKYQISNSTANNSRTDELIGEFGEMIDPKDPSTLTEEFFLDWLKDNRPNYSPEYFGQLWAYRMVAHDSKTEELFDRGHEFLNKLNELLNELGLEDELSNAEIVHGLAAELFTQLYD